jgi:dihydrofolate synthase/folylpolyglutamate synthase
LSATPSHAERLADLEGWLDWLETLHPKKIDLGLDRIVAVLASLGLTDPTYRVVTVGGTNGKGSCVALLENIYAQAGFRVGAYTSPHLWRFNERLRVDLQEASDAEIVAVFRDIDSARGEVSLSYFEFTTVAAMAWFAQREVDVAIMEVGLGGRLDAVNAIDPDASLIVSVDLDHQAWLGGTRSAIAYEKAGIMRSGRPTIVADRDPPATLLNRAEELDAQLILAGRDYDHDVAPDETWCYRSESGERLRLPLPTFGGRVQLGNAAACIALVRSLAAELPVSEESLALGISGAAIHARFERHSIDDVEWIFDVAHNPAAARVLAAELNSGPVRGRTFAILAAMADKDIEGVVEPFLDLVDEWLTVRVGGARAADAETLAETLRSSGAGFATAASDIASACMQMREKARPVDRIVVFGSCYIVGPAMTSLGLYCAPSLTDTESS